MNTTTLNGLIDFNFLKRPEKIGCGEIELDRVNDFHHGEDLIREARVKRLLQDPIYDWMIVKVNKENGIIKLSRSVKATSKRNELKKHFFKLCDELLKTDDGIIKTIIPLTTYKILWVEFYKYLKSKDNIQVIEGTFNSDGDFELKFKSI